MAKLTGVEVARGVASLLGEGGSIPLVHAGFMRRWRTPQSGGVMVGERGV